MLKCKFLQQNMKKKQRIKSKNHIMMVYFCTRTKFDVQLILYRIFYYYAISCGRFKSLQCFPNVWISLKILIFNSVASDERSFLKLNLIKPYLRSTLGGGR